MDSIKEIKIPSGLKYLGECEHFKNLPQNCLFDKGKVGCGGTHLALTDSRDYVIAVPYVSLIENKVEQTLPSPEKGKKYPNLMGVYGGFSSTEIREYLKETYIKKLPRKFIVTYDSLPKLMKLIRTSDYHFLIDEYHLLFTQYSFRYTAAKAVLSSFDQFKSFCFMTATPLERQFIMHQIKDLLMVKAVWEEVHDVKINSMHCSQNSVNAATKGIVKSFLNGEMEGNAYFFVNSLDFIKEMIRECKLDDSNCRVVYSKYNRVKLSIKRGTVNDSPKLINFLTSSAFEGCDILDEHGRIYVISDNKIIHSLVDISTSFQQIAGRIRNTKYWDTITHIFKETRYKEYDTYEEFSLFTHKEIERCQEMVLQFNKLESTYRAAIPYLENTPYTIKDELNVFHYDSNLPLLDLFNYRISNVLYKCRVNVIKELQSFKYNVVPVSVTTIENRKSDHEKLNFRQTVEKLSEFLPFKYGLLSEEKDMLMITSFKKYPFLREAIEVLGFDEIRRLKYHTSKIRNKLISKLAVPEKVKIFKALHGNPAFKKFGFIPSKIAIRQIEETCKQLGIDKKPHISDLFEVKEKVTKENNRSVRGFVIRGYKFNLN